MNGVFNMIIYSDQFDRPKIPSDVYMGIADFSIILGDIAKGAIPTGSKIPYPLFSEDELRRMQSNEQTLPWDERSMIREYTGPLGPYSAS